MAAGRIAWNNRQVTLVCPICRTVFKRSPAFATGIRYCCKACSDEAKRRVTGPAHKLYKGPAHRVCQWCGAAFTCKPAKVIAGEGKFCSGSCRGSYSASRQNGRRSSIELIVEAALKRMGHIVIAQKQLGPFLADLYLPDLKLAVECDGDYWHSLPARKAADVRKDAWLQQNGYRCIRLTEHAIRADVVSAIADAF